jgi:subtilisin family serine protease
MPFLILLSEQADVTPAKGLQTKEEKAFYVYDELRKVAMSSQKALINYLKEKNVTYQSLFIVNAIRVEGTQALIQSLAQRSDISRILDEPSIQNAKPVEWSVDNGHDRSTLEWGIERINANDAWSMGFRGQGVTVGGEDTGYEWTHPALKNQYRGYLASSDSVDHNYNWHDAIHAISPLNSDSLNPCGLDSREPCDDQGHGTHTMGTMIGLDGDNEIGVAPEAKWCGCRNMERGWGSPFTYIECFQWFLAPTDLNNENPDPTKSPHVINNSWGCPQIEGCDTSNWEVMNQVINILRLAGIVVVASAGNSGNACFTVSDPPAMFEGSFSVGATAMNDTIANFSSRGSVAVDSSFRTKPNVSAPGVGVRSARPGGFYGHASGTSMAGPHVAGLVALIISANPNLAGKVDIIEDIIEQSSVPKTTDQACGGIPGTQVPNNTYGFGRIDALAAVEAAVALIPVSIYEEAQTKNVMVYPNPVSDQLTFALPQADTNLQIDLFDANGKVIIRYYRNHDQNTIVKVDLSKQPAGVYFYRIINGDIVQQGKVIKN